MRARAVWAVALLGAVALVAFAAISMFRPGQRRLEPSRPTIGDLRVVHSDVRRGGRSIRGSARLSEAETITTGPDGRARLRLDDGALVVIDRTTELSVAAHRLTLRSGRIFVQSGPNPGIEVALGEASTNLASSSAAFERDRTGHAKVYCAQGDLVLRSGSRSARVGSGETAALAPEGLRVAPERAFDDWTGGLAVPWGNEGSRASALPELRGTTADTDPGMPLAIRSETIDVRIDGEFSTTRTRTVYFNGSEQKLQVNAELALPPGAILSRVVHRSGAQVNEGAVVIAKPPDRADGATPYAARLEWAGNGWLRGRLPSVDPGQTLELELEYGEWLTTRSGRATYRFPLAGGSDVLVGELHASVDAERTDTPVLVVSEGASVVGRRVDLRRADVHPAGDLVVELAPAVVRAQAARAYIAPGSPGEDPYVMVRAEVKDREDPGLALVIVLDTSMSAGTGGLETERAVLDALLDGLGPHDSVAVLAADQSVRIVGPALPQPVTNELRAELHKALGSVHPGGASNLGLALERAADVLDAAARGERAGSGVVVYLGDGRPTVGEPDAEHLRRRLARRAGGLPRMSAVAVGASADRWLLAGLVNGAGSVYEALDRADAARVGATLLADVLEPTVREVELDLGPGVDRVYPREPRAVLAGSTVTAIGRLRGRLPSEVRLRFRDGEQRVEERRALVLAALPSGADVAQRWAAARIEDITARGEGLEPAIVLAASANLVTPWTGWFFDAKNGVQSAPFVRRVVELSPERDEPFARYVDQGASGGSILLEPPPTFGGGVSLKEAAERAIRRTFEQARQAIRACREARLAVRPVVPRVFDIELIVGGDGHATRVRVVGGDLPERDPVLERCIESVVASLPYYAAGVSVSVNETLTLAEGRGARRSVCSPTSKLSLPIRRAVWTARPHATSEAYVDAERHCEVPAWSDKRELLLLILDDLPAAEERLELARSLDALGLADAASFVRKEILRRVKSFEELARSTQALLADEPPIDAELEKAYGAAHDDEARLEVVHRFLRLAPHSALARRRELALLEALGRTDALLRAIDSIRADPFADAGLLALGASALRRAGKEDEARRAFGELVERAPGDPWTLAFVGDRLRGEHLFDDAVDAYESLARLMPDDAGVSLRLALAHAGAGRLDIATRLLERVTQTGGRSDDGRLGELASMTQAVLLAGARAHATSADVRAELSRRLLQTPLPDLRTVLLVQSPPGESAVEVRVARETGERGDQVADFDARTVGLAAVRIERGDGTTRIVLKRRADLSPAASVRASVAALVLPEDGGDARLVTREVDVAADGRPVELRWSGEAFL